MLSIFVTFWLTKFEPMPNYSISDLGRSIVTTIDPYKKEFGGFSALLSPERKQAFHRINIEYLQGLSVSYLDNIEQLLHEGFTHNLQLTGQAVEHLQSINSHTSFIAAGIQKTLGQLSETNDLLKGILDAVSNPSATSSLEKGFLARKNLAQARRLEGEQAKCLIDEAYDLLLQAIEICPLNYQAYFDKGWIESFCYENLREAIVLFEECVMRSIGEDNAMTVHALRYLGDAYQVLDEYDEAIACIEKAVSLGAGDMTQLNLELFQLLLNGNRNGRAKDLFLTSLKENPKSISSFVTDAVFLSSGEARSWLAEIESKMRSSINSELISNARPKASRDLVLCAWVRPRVLVKGINIPLKRDASRSMEITMTKHSQTDFSYFESTLTKLLAVKGFSELNNICNSNDQKKLTEKEWLEISARDIFLKYGYKNAQVFDVDTIEVTGFIKLLYRKLRSKCIGH